jgi:magnesium transporter
MLQETMTPAALLQLVREAERDIVKAELRRQPETVLDAAFEEADRAERLVFLRLMPVERAASTFTDLPLSEQADVLPDIPTDRLRLMGAFIGPDEVADLLSELADDTERRQYLLMSLPKTLAQSAQELEQYEDDDAGGIMTPEYVAVREEMSVQQAIVFLRSAVGQAETITNLYLLRQDGVLVGTLPLQSLVTAPAERRLGDLAHREVICVHPDTDQETVARLMRDYDLNVLPVVDDHNVLKGIITIDDVVDVIEEEATEDFYKGAGMEGSEIEYLRTSPWELWQKRVLWLALLSVSELLTVMVNANYEKLLLSQIVLQSYTAALIGTGGNTGSQSAVLIIRAISQGQLRGRDAWHVLVKEFSTGLLLGITLAVFAFGRVMVFNSKAGLLVAIAVSLAVFFIVVVANVVGAMLPLLFSKLKIDPALTSSPFLATIMDATGLFIYFNIAKVVLGL